VQLELQPVKRGGPLPLLALLVVSALASASCSSVTSDLRERSIGGYRVVYRIEDRANPSRPKVATEVVEVRRPYGGRVEVRDRSGRVTSREHLWVLGKGGELSFGVLRPPGPPARDASLAALRDASRAGLVEMIGSGEIQGRRCAWFAYRKPAPDALALPTSTDRIESCVDSVGIVLHEVWTIDGRGVRIVEATSVDDGAPPASRFLEGKDPAKEKVTQPEAGRLVETSTLVADVDRDRERTPLRVGPPEGWQSDRASVVAVTAGGESRPTQFLSETFLKDGKLAIVEIGSSAQLAPPWGTDEGERIRLRSGEGRVLYFVDRVEIRLLSAIGFARVIAPSRAIALHFVNGLAPGR
jgi:hypothetical protein